MYFCHVMRVGFAVFLSLAGRVTSHGSLFLPAQRSGAWRFGFNNPVNYNDNQLFCGGSGVQWSAANNGRCGVCGDPYNAAVKPNEDANGTFVKNGVITGSYVKGNVMTTKVNLTAYHKGWFEFRLCPLETFNTVVTQACLNKTVLTVAGSNTSRIELESIKKGTGTGVYEFNLQLPSNITCDRCVLQWRYNTGNSWGCEPGKCCIGCGKQENFVNCADIKISDGQNGTTSTTESSSTSATGSSSTSTTERSSTSTTGSSSTSTTGSSSTSTTGSSSNSMTGSSSTSPTGSSSYSTAGSSSTSTAGSSSTSTTGSSSTSTTGSSSTSSTGSSSTPTTISSSSSSQSATMSALTSSTSTSKSTSDSTKSTSTVSATTNPTTTTSVSSTSSVPTSSTTSGSQSQTTSTSGSQSQSTSTSGSQSQTTTTSGNSNVQCSSTLTCSAAGIYANVAGIGKWCCNNCSRGFCPGTHCSCNST